MKKTIGILLGLLMILYCFAGCKKKSSEETVQHHYTNNIPPIDYTLDTNWITREIVDGSDYDLIFITGTAVMEQTQDNGVADISEEMKAEGLNQYYTSGMQLSQCGVNVSQANVFIPAYRQIAMLYSLTHYASREKGFEDFAAKEPAADLMAAMDFYFQNYNPNGEKPFVLAGYSQGGSAVQFLLENYFIDGGHKAYLKNMIAAYSTGMGVSEAWFNGLDKELEGREVLHFATGAYDYNCLISWNTEGPGEKGENLLVGESGEKTLVINPLNWAVDETYAGIELNEGVLVSGENGLTVSNSPSDLLDAQIDLQRGSLICTTKEDYIEVPILGKIFGGKSLHAYEGKGYYANMASNLNLRIRNFLNR